MMAWIVAALRLPAVGRCGPHSAGETETVTEPEDAAASQAPPKKSPVGGKLALGAGYGKLFDVAMFGPEVSGAIGGETPNGPGGTAFGGYATLTYERARSSNGLQANNVRALVTGEWILGRVRIGGGLHLQYLGLERKSGVLDSRVSDGHVIWRLGVGLHGSVSVDLVKFDAGALYVSATPELTLPLPLSNVSGAIGFRL